MSLRTQLVEGFICLMSLHSSFILHLFLIKMGKAEYTQKLTPPAPLLPTLPAYSPTEDELLNVTISLSNWNFSILDTKPRIHAILEHLSSLCGTSAAEEQHHALYGNITGYCDSVKSAASPSPRTFPEMSFLQFLTEPTPDTFFAACVVYALSTLMVYRLHQRVRQQRQNHAPFSIMYIMAWQIGMLVTGGSLSQSIASVPLVVSFWFVRSVEGVRIAVVPFIFMWIVLRSWWQDLV